MNKPKTTRFPLKIIVSYLVLAALAVIVSVFLFSELRTYLDAANNNDGKKVVETGSLINLVYETDSFSRLALLSEDEADFERFQLQVDSLYQSIADFRNSTSDESQKTQLDSIKRLLISKNKNIIALRELSMEMNADASLDDILRELNNLEDNMGKSTLSNTLNPKWRSKKERESWENIIKVFNYNKGIDTMKVPAKLIDSTLSATRFIVAEAKYLRNKNREELKAREAELIANDLVISKNLQELIITFDNQITKNYLKEKTTQQRSMQKASSVLKISGIVGLIVILLFSYIIISDFFRAEKLRKKLRLAKETTEEVLRSREQLIATVSHDLKTPLHTISGYTELFKNTPLTEKQTYYTDQIASGSRFITNLVNDLLDFSKLEAGKLKIDHIAFSLHNILFESGHAVKDRYGDKPVALNFTISEELEKCYFKSDPLRIRQIVLNLVSNAFKFTESGTVHIIAEIVSKKKKQTKVKITVKDSGIGISPEKQELIFKEFTQADEDTSRKFGGTGLGLAISKKLVGLLGGKISVISEVNHGSSFSVVLPLEPVSDNELLSAEEHMVSKGTLSERNLQALVFDDDPSMRSLLKEVLEQEGIACTAFEKFSEFETVAGAVDYDFVLTDIQMPDTNGFEVLKWLRTKAGMGYNQQPVIAMTGNQTHKSEHYFEQGFCDILYKPFHKSTLLNTLHTLFDTGTVLNQTHNAAPTSKATSYDLTMLKSFITDKVALNEIISVFLIQTYEDMETLRKAIDEDDIETIKAISHRKLTMTRQIEANKVVSILEQMELITTIDPSFAELFATLEDAINELVSELEQEID
ncbi:response regulator [Rasiella rasia]|uniref:histidine kinase n=1 Tax=Rasiella rasia TaxID=2744027 RepID=A0A6G6GM98_9FLAO|nr:hybrid sensor histidine kinase/response regulator [Rasiella rasia]QIE59533.1 response regulator [Rasiella rasia]